MLPSAISVYTHIVVYIHYTMVTSSENDGSEKANIIIGKLIDKAEQNVRLVISVFDNSQSRAVITKRFDNYPVRADHSRGENERWVRSR